MLVHVCGYVYPYVYVYVYVYLYVYVRVHVCRPAHALSCGAA